MSPLSHEILTMRLTIRADDDAITQYPVGGALFRSGSVTIRHILSDSNREPLSREAATTK